MSITKSFFGKTKDGIDIYLFSLKNKSDMEVKIITYGATIVSLTAPDKDGNYDDIVLGYDNIESYEDDNKFLGSIIGRCANIIEDAKITINNIDYKLDKNFGNNTLNGGNNGFHNKVWVDEIILDYDNILRLSYISEDGECGFPGNLRVDVTYSLLEDNTLRIDYKVISDKDTLVNLANHSYFNLAGHSNNSILDHKLFINSDTFINNNNSIPNGDIKKVLDSPMDFSTLKTIGEDIDKDNEQLSSESGYNHNWILNSKGNMEILSAKLLHEDSGRIMEIYTSKPTLKFYSGNLLDGTDTGKKDTTYNKRSGLCLIPQYVPNEDTLPSMILKANRIYRHSTIYKFSTL